MNHNIKHLAIIMDGNVRWAKANRVAKAEGHKKGAEVAKVLVPQISTLGIPYLTLYAFSSENWNRPADEVSLLINLLGFYIENELKILNNHQIKLKVIGNMDKLGTNLRRKIIEATESTRYNTGMTLYMAFGYGSREEIVSACQKIVDAGELKLSEEMFRQYLYDKDMPDVDLFIRPSGVYRMSNFLLWQSAYAELYFTDKFWPDFSIDDIIKAIEDYSTRTRTFGGRLC